EISSHVNDMNYFRGNVYNKSVINSDGTVQVVSTNVEYDTLPNGKLRPSALPGEVQKERVGLEDTFLRRNFQNDNSITYNDGDTFERLGNENAGMYNSPQNSEIG